MGSVLGLIKKKKKENNQKENEFEEKKEKAGETIGGWKFWRGW